MTNEQLLLECVRCALSGSVVSLSGGENLAALYALSEKHKMTAAVCSALPTGDASDRGEMQKFRGARAKSISRCIIQHSEADAALDALKRANIRAALFKSSQIARLYPEENMRISSDLDILVDKGKKPAVRAVLERLGYSCREFCAKGADVYHKPPIMNLEIHDTLFENDEFGGYFDHALEHTVAGEDGRLRMTDADLFIYSVAHFYKHFKNAGCGVRFLCDHFLMRRALSDADARYCDGELEKLGLKAFSDKMFAVADGWFGEGAAVHELSDIERYILGSGIYGSRQNYIEAQRLAAQKSAGSERLGKIAYWLSRIFPPYRKMALQYPAVHRHPVLMPFFWIYRIVTALLFKRDKLKRENEMIRSRHEK